MKFDNRGNQMSYSCTIRSNLFLSMMIFVGVSIMALALAMAYMGVF